VITAVNGYCIAGGMLFLLNSDIRIASATATFQFSEPRIAGFPGKQAVSLLVRQVGYVQAMSLLLTARRISATEALQAGLLTEVVDPDELLPRAESVAAEVAGMAPLTLRACKEAALIADGSAQVNLDGYITMLLRDTEDRTEGRLAFREKRPPKFTGK
jgi:enoyl-CoA hydratase/carnithine racemase